MKKKVKCTALILIALFVWSLCLAKYFDSQAGITITNADQLTVRLPYVPHISSYLNGSEYQLDIYNGCTLIFLAVLVLWRILLLTHFWEKTH